MAKAIQSKENLFEIKEVEIIYQSKSIASKPQVKSSNDIQLVLRELFDVRKIEYKEEFHVILLNRANRILGVSRIGVGSTTGVSVNIKEIFQLVLMSNASAVILSHNHPSGNPEPSNADLDLTNQVFKSCQLIEVKLLDHVILTADSFYSMTDNGLI